MFQSYKSTVFAPWLLPIIPVAAKGRLTAGSKIDDDKLGKIPGQCYPHLGYKWCGKADWTAGPIGPNPDAIRQILANWDGWYYPPHQTIGMQGWVFPGIDLDVNTYLQAEIAKNLAFEIFGVTVLRGRSDGSPRLLLPYRIVNDDPILIRKIRQGFKDDSGEFAIEILGRGRQYLIEGDHSKGGTYVWHTDGNDEQAHSMLDLPDFGAELIPRITLAQCVQFMKALGEQYQILLGAEFSAGKVTKSSSFPQGEIHDIGPDHPQVAPDMVELVKAAGYVPVLADELESYDMWETFLRAFKTACAGDELYYTALVRWNQEKSLETTIRSKWESHRDSSVGWEFVCNLAARYGYVRTDLFGPVEDEAVRADDGAQHGSDGQSADDPADQAPGQPSAAPASTGDGASNPNRTGPPEYERTIATKFVSDHAGKDWTYVYKSRTSGDWYRFADGTWSIDYGSNWAVGEECHKVSNYIRAKGGVTQAELGQAKYLSSAHGQANVAALVKSHPKMHTKREKLDRLSWYMGVPGGHIDKQGHFIKGGDPALWITKRAGCAPDASVECPRWEEAMMRLSNNDLMQYLALRSALGYTMSGTGRELKFFYLLGQGANEGKTSFLTCFAKLMGDYTHELPDAAFVAGKGVNDKFVFGQLEGCWFAYRGEVAAEEEWETAGLKEKTGGGRVSVESKQVMAVTTPITWGLWFQGNFLPRFRRDDPGLRKRMVIFDCQIPLEKREQTDEWADAVYAEEGPGIMAWLIAARQDYQANGLVLPESMTQFKDDYLDTQDHLGMWIEGNVRSAPGNIVHGMEFYQAYKLDRDMQDQRAMSYIGFMRQLVNHKKAKALGLTRGWQGSETKRWRSIEGARLIGGEEMEAEEGAKPPL